MEMTCLSEVFSSCISASPSLQSSLSVKRRPSARRKGANCSRRRETTSTGTASSASWKKGAWLLQLSSPECLKHLRWLTRSSTRPYTCTSATLSTEKYSTTLINWSRTREWKLSRPNQSLRQKLSRPWRPSKTKRSKSLQEFKRLSNSRGLFKPKFQFWRRSTLARSSTSSSQTLGSSRTTSTQDCSSTS